jgi:alpha-beta hydrolase superfamily lysophospholipase
VALFFITFITGCNSLFYHPDALNWTLPQQTADSFEDVRIPVGDSGESLHAWLFKTNKPKTGTVVHFHGNAQNMSAHILFVGWLLDEGFDLLTFDYRGYGQSSPVVTRERTLEDGHAVLNWASKKDPSAPLFVIGQSLGGAVAATVLSQKEYKHIKAVMLESTFHSYRSMAQSKLASFFLTWPLQWPLSFLVSDTLSPALFATEYNYPTLVVHGSRDAVVPFSEGLGLAEFLKASGKAPVAFRMELSRGHTPCFTMERPPLCKKAVVEFFNQNARGVAGNTESSLP